ncbi:fimbrial biogenesis chaperone [Proteus hauseri]|uniref:fimbrial biogenesis chaperone n=1 Tax=Proteus hauseri TaxID=183417 RepID=UPI0010095D97|nr:molecular chaperone [Proteus hauseri]QAV24750.1 molecular chaperone [Proteus hauseri]
MKKYNQYILFTIILCSSFLTYANVIYSGTRFIYNESDNHITISVKNKNIQENYLIQSWITKENNKKTPFIITPPLFKLKGSQDSVLKLTKIEPIIENNRESIFYLNSKAIPLKESDNNSLHISLKSVFKLFYRPTGLPESIDEATKKVFFCINSQKELVIKNKSVYHFTILSIFTSNNKKDISFMIEPFSELNIGIVDFKTNILNWSYINDFGNEVNVTAIDNK